MPATVVLSMLNAQQDFQRAQVDEAKKAASRCGIELEVVFALDSAATQRQQLFSSLQAPKEKRPVALVVESATNEGLAGAARAAVQEGIGWVLTTGYPTYIEPLNREFPAVLVASACADEDEIGRIMAQQYRALLPQGGAILYIEGLVNSAGAVIRRRRADEDLRGSSVKIAKVIAADWSEERAEEATRFWFKFNSAKDFRPDLIACQNDAIAVGARRAIAAQRPDWSNIPVTGCDGLPGSGQKLVNERALTATVVKPPTAGKAIEMVAAFLRHESSPPRVVLSPASYPAIEQLRKRGAGASPTKP